MEFNPSKCNVIRIMPNKQRKVLTDSYFLRGQTLETTSASKYLGTTISSDLSWSSHVEDVAARGNRTAGFLRRNFRECTPKVKSETYTTMVRPHWSMSRLSGIPISERNRTAGKGSTQSSQACDQQLHRQIIWHCYIHAWSGRVLNTADNKSAWGCSTKSATAL